MSSSSGEPERRPPDPARGNEIEIKLPAPDLDAVRGRLRESEARLVAPRHFEANDLYDDSEGSIAKRGCTLRLRRTPDAALLTFKGPAQFSAGIKTREERETTVTNPDELDRILTGLGYRPRFRYEKHREEWTLEKCVIALDETPIGTFVEVEGDPTAIRGVLPRLGLDPADAIPYSYAGLYSRRRRDDPSLPADMLLEKV
ncbi:MAG: class IV adenylate cyclase [Acidobacteriota bacterium]|nr:class IV adenylate cyclase [Acidobacteriota bacterium]